MSSSSWALPTSAVLVLLQAWLVCSADVAAREERLIGWQGESNIQHSPQKHVHAYRGPRWIETISWKPRAFVFHNFLSELECDHLVNLTDPRMQRSWVVDAETGQAKMDDIRTSYGSHVGLGEDEVIAGIEAKIADWTHLPASHGEAIQVLKYKNGQKYGAHWDWFTDPVNANSDSGNRVATVLMYLSDVEEGGETALPLADAIDPERQKLDNVSECAAKHGIAVMPSKGDALLFWDLKLDGQTGDRSAMHAACPTTKGTKYTATKWIHNKPINGQYDPWKTAGECKDKQGACEEKKRAGECETDAALTGAAGTCRRTCGDCIDCPEADVLCLRMNAGGRLHRIQEGS